MQRQRENLEGDPKIGDVIHGSKVLYIGPQKHEAGYHHTMVVRRCPAGHEWWARLSNFRDGRSKNCPHCRRAKPPDRTPKPDDQFGLLRVTRIYRATRPQRGWKADCKCDCHLLLGLEAPRTRTVGVQALLNGTITACQGCQFEDVQLARFEAAHERAGRVIDDRYWNKFYDRQKVLVLRAYVVPNGDPGESHLLVACERNKCPERNAGKLIHVRAGTLEKLEADADGHGRPYKFLCPCARYKEPRGPSKRTLQRRAATKKAAQDKQQEREWAEHELQKKMGLLPWQIERRTRAETSEPRPSQA